MKIDTVVVGDWLDVSKDIPSDTFDLAILDPPFNLGVDYDVYDDNKPLDEYLQLLKQWTQEAERILKPGRLLFMWQAGPNLLKVWNQFPQARLFAGCKDFVTMRKVDVQWAFDPLLFWNKESSQGIFSQKEEGMIRRDWHIGLTSVWKAKANIKWHPCPRPLDTVMYLIESWSFPGELVLDPFMGSGTTAEACIRTGRHYFGCDISDYYVLMSRERTGEVPRPMAPGQLF